VHVSAVGSSKPVIRFADFEVDLRAGELLKNGQRIRLQAQPFQVLAMLLERPGETVTREELQKRIWPEGTFVDFDQGLNNAVKKLREALGEDAANPRYVETLSKRGYRFVAAVAADGGNGKGPSGGDSIEPREGKGESAGAAVEANAPSNVRARRIVWAGSLAGVLVLAAIAAWVFVGRPVFSFRERDSILIADFENHTGDARFDDALLTAFSVSLEQSRYANVVPRGRIEAALKRMGKSPKEHVSGEIAREISQREGIRGIIASSITRTGRQYALTAQLIDPGSGVAVRSYSERAQGEDQVLDALDKIGAKIRADLGESLYQIRRADRPLPQVTTTSLTALKHYADGRSLWSSGKFTEAVVELSAATALDPEFAMAHAGLGHAYCSNMLGYQRERGAGEYQKALSRSSRVTERERRIIEISYTHNMGHVEDAERLFRLYLSDYPDDWEMRENYGRLLRLHGQGEEAIQQYKEALRIAPNDAVAYIDLATINKGMGRPAEAVAAYTKGFSLEPTRLEVSNINREYGFALIANGEEAKAEQVFANYAADPARRASGLDSLGLLDFMHGRYSRARKRYEESLSLAEREHDTFLAARNHFLLAVEAAGESDRPREIRELDAIMSDFGNLGPKVEYGSLVGQEFAHAGAIAKAEEIAKRIAPLADVNSDEQSGYLRLLQGEITLAKGDALNAAHLFDLQDPRYGSGSIVPISTEALARAYQRAGKSDDAIAWYARLLRPGSPGDCVLNGWTEVQQRCVDARLALAREYLKRGDVQKAGGALAPLLKAWQDADPYLAAKKQALELASRTAN
jgi:DNA-binding winged helix-turn-helix (wHTH) protein/Tfp pilus assembly protein PilF/TolB-like protein